MIVVSEDLKRIITSNVSSATMSIIDKISRRGPTGPPQEDWDETVVSVGRGAEGFGCRLMRHATAAAGWKNWRERGCVVAPSNSMNNWTNWCRSVEKRGRSCCEKAGSLAKPHGRDSVAHNACAVAVPLFHRPVNTQEWARC
jgi:hypothetical protein